FSYILQSMFLMRSLPNSEHLTSRAPSIKRAKSYVTTLDAIVLSIDFVIKSAASRHSRCSSINTPDRMTDEGFTLSSPAYFGAVRSEEHTSELQSRFDLVCRLLLEKNKRIQTSYTC